MIANYFLNKEVNPLYDMKLCVNETEPLKRIVKISDSSIYLSGTWNKWLLDTLNNRPFFSYISNDPQNKVTPDDLLKLKYLLCNSSAKMKIHRDLHIENPDSSISGKFSKQIILDKIDTMGR